MTLAEYSIVIQWMLDDRLQFYQLVTKEWEDWPLDRPPSFETHFTQFRRKPESGASDPRPATHHGHGGSTDPSADLAGGSTFQAQVK